MLLVVKKDKGFGENALRIFTQKVFSSAGLSLDEVTWTSLEEGKVAVWNLIKVKSPNLIITEGREVTRILLKKGSSFRLEPFLHEPQANPWEGPPIVPLKLLSSYLKGSRSEIESLVRCLARCRNYDRRQSEIVP